MRIHVDHANPGTHSLWIGTRRIDLRLPGSAQTIPVEDDPATLARLAAIMSDRVVPCPTCGADPHVCRAIGCETAVVPRLLLASGRT